MKTIKKSILFKGAELSRDQMKKIIGGTDQPGCDSTYDCPDGQTCVNGHCQGKKSLGTPDGG